MKNYNLRISFITCKHFLKKQTTYTVNVMLPFGHQLFGSLRPQAPDFAFGQCPTIFGPRPLTGIRDEPKPQHSYIGLIAMAILSNDEKKMVLSDIYQWIMDHYPYFRTRGPGWRNSIRHNLSLNDCFVKAGRSANGKGHYWAVHPANVEDFLKGDFRRRRAQRKVRKHMGLSVNDEDDSDNSRPGSPTFRCTFLNGRPGGPIFNPLSLLDPLNPYLLPPLPMPVPAAVLAAQHPIVAPSSSKKRQFNVDSLLATEDKTPQSPLVASMAPCPEAAHLLPTSTPFFPHALFGNGPIGWPFGLWPPNQFMPASQQSPPPSCSSSSPVSSNGGSPKQQTVGQQDAAPDRTSDNGSQISEGRSSPNAAQWQESMAKIMARSYQNRSIGHHGPKSMVSESTAAIGK